MSFIGQVDSSGHIAFPEEVVADLGLAPGDFIRVNHLDSVAPSELVVNEGDIATGSLIDEDGLLVWSSSGQDVPELDRHVLTAIRHERYLRNVSPAADTLD